MPLAGWVWIFSGRTPMKTPPISMLSGSGVRPKTTKFELIINLKTAKRIGVTIPREVHFRADKVIK